MVDLGIPGLVDFEEIGSGGFATVFSAVEPEANRRVAVKVLAAMDAGGQRRFDRERRTMGQTSAHDNIVTMFRSGYTNPGNQPYLVMEHMPRGSLQDHLDSRGSVGVVEAVEFLLPVIDGLGFAHSTGIVHKDVKPANILISATGSPKLSDFGIAGIRDATGTSHMAFSLLYTPPETFDATTGPGGETNDPRDERSDLYSVAATLYTLITGSPLFWADSQAALMRQILTDPPPRIGDPALDGMLAKALAKNPDHRFETAEQLAAAFQAIRRQGSAAPLINPQTVVDTAPPAADPQQSVDLFHQAELDKMSPPVVPSPNSASTPFPSTSIAANSLASSPLANTSPTDYGQHSTPLAHSQPVVPPADATRSEELLHNVQPPQTRNSRTPLLVGGAAAVLLILGLVGGFALLNRGDDDNATSAGEEAISTDENPTSTEQPTTTAAPTTTEAPTTLAPVPEPIVFSGHSGQVWAVAALDDGRVVSGSPDNTVQVWDPDDVEAEPTVYTGHTDTVVAVAALSDGRIASAGWGSTVHVWDPDDPDATPALFTGHSRGVESLVELSDGRVASAATDATVQVWDPDDPGTAQVVYDGHTGPLRTVVELPDGRIASASDEATVHVWDPADPEGTAIIYTGHDRGVEAITALSDGRIASASDDAQVHIWDPAEPDLTQAIYTGHTDRVMALVELSDGRIATSSRDTTVQIWNPDETGFTQATFTGHSENVLAVDELPDRRIVSASDDSTVQVWVPADQ